MIRRRLVFAIAALMVAASVADAQEPPPPDPTWQIAHVRGGLYRVNAGSQGVTVFYVTGDGIVLVDPLGAAVASWLKRELESRFPDQAVRYVVYTHHHFDRASGGAVFDKTAEHIGHDSFFEERTRSAATLPSALAVLDLNRNGVLDRDEVSGTTFESLFAVYDRNEDRRVTSGEIYSFVSAPERVYSVRRTLTLNGKSVELMFTPTGHAADMTAVYFSTERVLFAADLVSIRSMPPAIGTDVSGTIDSISRIESTDFDTLLTGTGDAGTRADVGVFLEYLQQLSAGVRAGFDSGLTVEETKRLVTLERFSGLAGFSTLRESNIAELYAGLRPVLTSLHWSTHLNLQRVQVHTCNPVLYDSCVSSAGFPPLGGALGLSVAIDRLTVGGEVSSGQPKTARHLVTDSFFEPYELVLQHRDTIASFLAGYRLGRGNGPLVNVEGGVSMVVTHSRLTAFRPTGPGSDGIETSTQLATTFGATISAPLGVNYSLIVPVRLTITGRPRPEIEGVRFTLGAGLLRHVARGSR